MWTRQAPEIRVKMAKRNLAEVHLLAGSDNKLIAPDRSARAAFAVFLREENEFRNPCRGRS